MLPGAFWVCKEGWTFRAAREQFLHMLFQEHNPADITQQSQFSRHGNFWIQLAFAPLLYLSGERRKSSLKDLLKQQQHDWKKPLLSTRNFQSSAKIQKIQPPPQQLPRAKGWVVQNPACHDFHFLPPRRGGYQVFTDALLPCLNKLWNRSKNVTATTFIAEVTIGSGYLAGKLLLVTAAEWRV